MPRSAVLPQSPEELASFLGDTAARDQSICLGGRFTKSRMAGPIPEADVTVSTAGLRRVLLYEPRDLTISVEAGIPYAELSRVLAENRQMIPLDPPFAAEATIGGVLAANTSGPRRRLYGTARDLVIGMKFATLEGKLVQSGGMVVKNVAGLDMGKLVIGSFGTLAAIAVVNFKLLPKPQLERHFLLCFDALEEALRAKNGLLRGVLQPASVDLLNRAAAAKCGVSGYALSVEVGGNPAVIERYERELGALGDAQEAPASLGADLREFTPRFLAEDPEGAVVRVSCPLSQVDDLLRQSAVPVVARAGSGVCYTYFSRWEDAVQAAAGPWNAIIEFSPEVRSQGADLWPRPGKDLDLMKRVKHMLDPKNLLNRGRLYQCI